MYGTDNTDAKAVICRDNDMMYPMINIIWIYAKRLTDTMRTLDVTARKLKTPYFITCDEAQKSSIKKYWRTLTSIKIALLLIGLQCLTSLTYYKQVFNLNLYVYFGSITLTWKVKYVHF